MTAESGDTRLATAVSGSQVSDLAVLEDCDAILSVLLEDWPDTYEAGRRALLSRLAFYRAGQSQALLMKAADHVYRALVGFGEELAEMRWIHLAVECRDMLLHGY
jgi:hypothetical protein